MTTRVWFKLNFFVIIIIKLFCTKQICPNAEVSVVVISFHVAFDGYIVVVVVVVLVLSYIIIMHFI